MGKISKCVSVNLLLLLIIIFPASKVFSELASDPDDSAPLLHDDIEINKYISEFPFDLYRVCTVPRQGSFYVDQGDDYIKSYLRDGSLWEPYIHLLLAKHIKPGTTVVDLGAHIGTHTIAMSKYTGPNGRVIAFEPQLKISESYIGIVISIKHLM